MTNNREANAQARQFETRRKLDMLLEWVDMQSRLKQHHGAYGRMLVEITWEAGSVKRVKLIDEVTIEDLTPKELELVLRRDAESRSGKPSQKNSEAIT